MKLIKLTQGKYALVDDADYDRVNALRWHVKKGKCDILYARTNNTTSYRRRMYMHGFILNLNVNDKRCIDHRNSNGLDNQRSNLRFATNQENSRHSRKHRDAVTSIYKGVYWEDDRNIWRAYIYLNKKKIWLGRYATEIGAARAYNDKARELFGNYAILNDV